MQIKSRYKFGALSYGFTLVELLVSVAIITVIIGVVIFDYSTFNDNLSVSSGAQEVAVAIREAQSYGLSVKETSVGSGVFTSSYGIYFDKYDPSNYFIFADTNGNNIYDAGTGCGSLTTECIEKFNLRNYVKITGLCDSTNCPAANDQTVSKLNIIFLRPSTDARIYFTDSSGIIKVNLSPTARIILTSERGSTYTVAIDSNGQISVYPGSDVNRILTVTKSGNGTGNISGGVIDCGTTCSGTVDNDSQVTLTATPDTGSTFVGWSGDCSGTGSCDIVMNSNRSVTATFSSSSSNWWNSSWHNRRKITFDNSASSASLTNFPVLVTLTSANIDYSKTHNNGADLRFVDSDGTTELSYQIEKWDISGTSIIWVKVPTLSNNNSDNIYMYYNNASASSAEEPASVWDSNFKGVWHLSDGSTLNALDSTSNANNGTLINTPTATSGKIDGAAAFNGSSLQYISVSNPANLGLTTGTISGWIRASSPGSSYRAIFTKQDAYGLFLKDGVLIYYDWSGTGDHSTGVNLGDGNWHYVAQSFQSGLTNGTVVYIDGVVKLTSSMTVLDQNVGFDIGCGGNSAQSGNNCDLQFITGTEDEVRVSSSVRSADWIKAEYLSETGSMNTYGSEESP